MLYCGMDLQHGGPKKYLFVVGVLALAYVLWLFVPHQRTYFPFLIGSYVLAFVIYRLRGENFARIFDKSIWFHKTSLNEAYILIISFFFVSFIINKGYIFTPEPFIEALLALFRALHIPISTAKPTMLVGAIYLLCLILAYEAAYYFAHRMLHANKYLWEFHKVHHSAQVMTPFTSLRQHPVELMLNTIMHVLFVASVSAIFLYFYPTIPALIILAQSHMILGAYLLLGGSLAHSHAWLSYGPLDQYIVSPALHQVHHSTNPKHFDKNFGFMLMIFDRLFGTAYIPKEREELTFGLGAKEDPDFTHLQGVYIGPFIRSYRKAARAKAPVAKDSTRKAP